MTRDFLDVANSWPTGQVKLILLPKDVSEEDLITPLPIFSGGQSGEGNRLTSR